MLAGAGANIAMVKNTLVWNYNTALDYTAHASVLAVKSSYSRYWPNRTPKSKCDVITISYLSILYKYINYDRVINFTLISKIYLYSDFLHT